MSTGVLVRFVLSLLIGGGAALGVGALTSPSAVTSATGVGQAATYALTNPAGQQVDFAVAPADVTAEAPPVQLAPLPADQTLQLISYVQTNPTGGTAAAATRPAWWNAGQPRVPAISQFDGGPLANANCTMAAGAMLARLAFGIMTTGSQLRALQSDQEGGTSLVDLQAALDRGWGVRFFWGTLTPLQLRALLFAGAGAVVQGTYGEIPAELSLQAGFTEGHAIYLDGFRPPGPDGPAAYYVMDPLGQPWQGYRGAWWPADVIERFGLALGGGRIMAAWGFAGGIVPPDHPILPLDAYPTAAPAASPSAGRSPGGSPAALPTPTATPGSDPMPPGDQGQPPEEDGPGDTPPSGPVVPGGVLEAGVSKLVALFAHCTSEPIPPDCPGGLIGLITIQLTPTPPASPPPIDLHLLYATPVGPGVYQVIFESPPGAQPELWYWAAGTGGSIQPAVVEAALLAGQPVDVATVTVAPGTEFSFLATAVGDGIRAASPVGSLVIGQ